MLFSQLLMPKSDRVGYSFVESMKKNLPNFDIRKKNYLINYSIKNYELLKILNNLNEIESKSVKYNQFILIKDLI